MTIFVNQVYGYLKEQDENDLDNDLMQQKFSDSFRVIAISEDKAAVIDIETLQAVPYWQNISDIEFMISEGSLFILEEPFVLPSNDKGISNRAKERRDQISMIVNRHWEEDKEDLLNKNTRNKSYHEIAIENSLSFNKVRRSFSNFWQKGMTDNALLDDYSNCGNYGIKKMEKESSSKLGRKCKPRLGKEQPQGIKITAKDVENIRISINKYYNTKQCKTLRQVHTKMWKTLYRRNVYDSKGKKIGTEKLPLSEVPSYRQFIYWYKLVRNLEKELIGRHGYSSFMRKFRPLSGISLSGVVGPGSQYQIDSTIADIYIQMEHGDLVFGRPVIFGITDSYTGMIVAVHVSVNPASWTEASSCLLNMVEDKVEFCRRYDIDITEEMWPSKNLPSSIITDRGEFISDKSRNFTKYTGVELKHTPPFRPDLKGIVEQKFNIYNQPTQRFLPGAVRKGYGDRGERRPELDATMTLKEFTKIIISLVLKHNNSGHRRKQGAKEVRVIPTVEWEYGIKNHSGSLKVVNNLNSYKLSLMTEASGRINRSGLVWDGLLYDYYNINEEGTSKKFVYDQRDMSTIYLPNRDWTGYKEVFLKGDSKKYKGLTLDEIQFDFDVINDKNAIIEKEDFEKNVESLEIIENIINVSNKEEEQYVKPTTQSEIINGKRERKKAASNEYNKSAAIRPEQQIAHNQENANAKSTGLTLVEKRKSKGKEKIERAMKLQNEKQEKENRNE
ncbi:MAG TPA: transposase family protein [Patescibacteria group bacterium]|nr:transposase family protein [Patescibacteria group bacterium]